MNTNVYYALLDWDNTLRKGFTITSWTEYLCAQNAIEGDTYSRIMKQFELHCSQKISYAQLASTTTEIYARALTGIKLCTVEKLACSFLQEDDAVFPFVNKLFCFFKRNQIDTIIVSGAPQIVLLQYAKQFGIDEIHGMDIEISDGRYTGEVTQDYGAEKAQIVKEICNNRNSAPLIAFGDSDADMPLLKAAKYGYFLDRKKEMIILNSQETAPLSSIDTIIKKMSSLCHLNN
ncbi:HAD-IB family phosphatase [Lachnospiraceae bacterium 45-P1]